MHKVNYLIGCTAAALCCAPLSAGAPLAAGNDDASSASSDEAVDETLEETGTPSTDSTTRRTFTPEDFARFAPRSALDMAQQIPGFSIRQGDGARGLGQADTNVIINGRRISGKSNGPVAALQRIPTEEVVRLELVDGASLDIGGLTGQVLNVVTSNSGGITGQFRYAPQFRSENTPLRWGDGSISIAGGGEKTEWTLALGNDQNRLGDDGPEFVFDGAGNLIETRQEIRNDEFDRLGMSGSFARIATNGNVFNATGQIGGFFRREIEVSDRVSTINPVGNVRTFTSREDEFNFEVGVDYQFRLAGGRLKLIAFHGYEDSPTVSASLTEFADESVPAGTRFARDADEGETIARAEYSFDGLGGNLLIAAEGVRNFLDITSVFEARDAAGNLQPVAFPGATARVDEDRADLGFTYSRPLAPKLQFQVSAGGEYSRISQSGAFGQTRTFYRPKGFVALDWKASDRLSLSGRVERVVGQLNFFDFLATVDLDQDREDVTNANLVPQQSWVIEIEASIGLGALGSLNLRPFYEDITDIVDQIPIAGGGQAPGNLPSAQFFGLNGDLTLLSEALGWRGTRFDLELLLTDSAVRDPLLGFTRKISGNTLVNIDADLRHDFPGAVWAIGGSARWQDFAPSVRLDEISLRSETFGFVSAFVENKDVAGLTMRAQIANLVDRQNRFDRTVFVDRAAGIIDFVESRRRTFGTIFTLEIEGSF
jgi:hypothetical protein